MCKQTKNTQEPFQNPDIETAMLKLQAGLMGMVVPVGTKITQEMLDEYINRPDKS